MLENIEVLAHSSIRISKNRIIYIDPFNIEKNYNDADLIFITHDHYDHYSEEDIDKVKKDDTVFIVPEELLTKLLKKGIRNGDIGKLSNEYSSIIRTFDLYFSSYSIKSKYI